MIESINKSINRIYGATAKLKTNSFIYCHLIVTNRQHMRALAKRTLVKIGTYGVIPDSWIKSLINKWGYKHD
ncbi:hypothetical protein SAMN02745124_02027 [Desulfofustis glycolicus DSM 9705]|uniref:Uncharacterized protein n=1 Tax=Desulfofustis glycolicus DSM 9705 TaxID=1121409 RepID=A0A1M5W1E8_9BACT|nr:hypothetical protein SAMN02745124_02027 [Desulfofustis glycolicus DSM 9705]